MHSLINKLTQDYPQFHFEESSDYLWSARKSIVYFDPSTPHSQENTLHELSHALLDHHQYTRDIDLIKLERDAWNYALDTLAPKYGVVIDEDTVQDSLDTYRDWLYARSTCPECETTGIETSSQMYRCFACGQNWRVNEARVCALRRYAKQTK